MTTNRRTKKPTLDAMLDSLLTAVGLAHPNDPSRAGVVLSRLQDGSYYASLVRYLQAYGQGKVVVCKATGKTSAEAVDCLARTWRAVPRDAEAALRDLDTVLKNRSFNTY